MGALAQLHPDPVQLRLDGIGVHHLGLEPIAAVPLQKLVPIRVFGSLTASRNASKPGAADVLRRCLPGAIDQNGVLCAGFGGQGSFDGDPVHLLVAQVVNVGKAVDAALEELIQAEVGAAVDGVAAQGLAGFLWRAVAAAVGLKLVQVAVFQSKTA